MLKQKRKLVILLTALNILLSWCFYHDPKKEILHNANQKNDEFIQNMEETQSGTSVTDKMNLTEEEKITNFIQTRDLKSCKTIVDQWLQTYCLKQAKNYIAFDRGDCFAILDHPELKKECWIYQEKMIVYKTKLAEYEKYILAVKEEGLNNPEKSIVNTEFLANLNEFEEAIAIWKKLYTENPQDVPVILNYAKLLMQKGSLEMEEEKFANQSIELAYQALAIEENNAEAWRVIGYSNEIMEKYPEALKAYNQAINLDSNDSFSYSNR